MIQILADSMENVALEIEKYQNTSETSLHAMGWLRLVGSLKFQVSFAKEPYKRAYILQKSAIILRSLLTIATP